MQISMMVKKIEPAIFKNGMDGEEILIKGMLCSWHSEDNAIDIALEKADLFDNIIFSIKNGIPVDDDWIKYHITNKELLN